MIPLLASSLLTFSFTSKPVPEFIANMCADAVGIPPNSDNFLNAQFEQFKSCILFQNK